MIFQKKSRKLQDAFQRQAKRLSMPSTTKYAVFLLPVGLMSLLLIYVLFETNPRLGSQSKPIELHEPESESSGRIWYSIFPTNSGLRITSNNGEIFDLNKESYGNELASFKKHLDERRRQTISDVAVAKRIDSKSTFVVLSVDERLTYGHVRPIIYALAEAGFSRYGFEGRVVNN